MGDGSPLKEDDPRFPDNYNGARKRLTNIENKMDRDPLSPPHTRKSKINRGTRVGILFRFRIGSVAFTETSGTCFASTCLRSRSTLFLWRGADRDSEPCIRDDFADFGASSSPTSAIYVLNKMRKHVQMSTQMLKCSETGSLRGRLHLFNRSLSAESSAEAATVSLHKTKTERALIWEPECDSLGSKIELHVFGDASEHAYAAAAWRRHPDGTVHLALVAGKSRVAPNKVMSIPRLELQAALACRPATNIREHGIATERRVLLDPPGAYVRPGAVLHPQAEEQQQPFGADDVIDAETRLWASEGRSAMKCGPPPWRAATPRKQSTGAGRHAD
ncbi:hypothetical protein EVAR_89649_1 [Eumeta japonica]|uniref:Uncharacterized protein n=1 Tax=Eumeta variegata TaxID=151549 RepID=A0A4C1ZBE1_EUMVA|nr:hypothetical protein EVAR_89649_1 [Eumeta japonica]